MGAVSSVEPGRFRPPNTQQLAPPYCRRSGAVASALLHRPRWCSLRGRGIIRLLRRGGLLPPGRRLSRRCVRIRSHHVSSTWPQRPSDARSGAVARYLGTIAGVAVSRVRKPTALLSAARNSVTGCIQPPAGEMRFWYMAKYVTYIYDTFSKTQKADLAFDGTRTRPTIELRVSHIARAKPKRFFLARCKKQISDTTF